MTAGGASGRGARQPDVVTPMPVDSARVMPETAATIMARYRGIGPGFDFWRFSLSSFVILLHSFHVSYGTNSPASRNVGYLLRPLFAGTLPVFFALSGFLVAGSAIRTRKITIFLGFRALRLVPALAMEVTLSALILGPILTTRPLGSYFADHHFIAYFGNIVGRIRYVLPGVFETNPVPLTVNENLWTLHAELLCYVLMTAAILVGLLNARRVALAMWVAATLVLAGLNLAFGYFEPAGLYPPSVWVYAFCTGVVAFLWSDRVPVSGWASLALACAYGVLVYLPHTIFPAVIALTYLMIYVGMQPRLSSPWFRKGDYSYGLYLYGFVIQQTFVLLVPAARHWWIVFPCSWLFTLAFAAASWHIVEKPALRLKRYLSPRAASIPSSTEPASAAPVAGAAPLAG